MPFPYRRPQIYPLLERLAGPSTHLIVVGGPRQVGKTALVEQALAECGKERAYWPVDNPLHGTHQGSPNATAPEPGRPADAAWLVEKWLAARELARLSTKGFVLAFDEIQKIPRWSEVVKGLWDADRAAGLDMHVVLLGSSPLLMQRGITESLAGRFELLRLTHWSFLEMFECFQYSLEDYLYFGGYPGSERYIRKKESDWRDFIITSLIQPSIELDILMMTRIDKPALLKQAFELGCAHSGQIMSYNKMLGHLHDAGNTVTLAHYLDLLGKAGLLVGLHKYSGQVHRQRSSSPKLNVLNPCFMAVHSGYTKAEALADRTFWGHQVESVVGAHLFNSGVPEIDVYYWRDGAHEVDFVIEKGTKLTAIEVKSGSAVRSISGLAEFQRRYPHSTRLIVGTGGIPLTEFLSHPAEHWLGQSN